MSWKPEFQIGDQWCGNAVRFATKDEAECNARAKFMVWTMPKDYRVVESDDPVNYRWVDGQLEEVKDGQP